MENLQPEAAAASGGIVAPKIASAAAREPFAVSDRERLAALLTYPLAYLYIRSASADAPAAQRLLLAAFALGFFALSEYLYRGVSRARESWVWLGCAAAVLASILLERGNAWEEGLPVAFLHIFAVWWALSRSGALLAGESGSLLPLDALNGFALFPFGNLPLRLRTAWTALARLRRGRAPGKEEAGAAAWTLAVTAAALGLLALAANLLIDADSGFAALARGFFALLRFDWDFDRLLAFAYRVLFSLPVGAYLYGLLGGALRADRARLRSRAAEVGETLELLRGVPARVWLALLSLFCALYALFFAVQGRYLFGAFTRTLPAGFLVSEYARQGFFELCKVMAVNFALLWLVTRSARTDGRGRRALRALCLALLSESFLLAVVALSKLALYIDCFGFTPRRLQSTWLACVLAFGCCCAAWSLARGEKTFRVWMYFGAVTLSLLCLY